MTPILINEYDYPLPEDRIAKYPLRERDKSKLLVYQNQNITESRFEHLDAYLPTHSLLVRNNTRVIQARMVFHKQSGARIEIFCLEPIQPRDYQLALSQTDECVWKCMVGNLKKWKSGLLQCPIPNRQESNADYVLSAERISTTGNTHLIRFSWNKPDTSFAEILEQLGELPIPPYLNRPTEESDKTTYQTVYARIKGSVAAPTAGLHFTQSLLNRLQQNGTQIAELTLHVGAGTFQPVKVEDANQHIMHTEIIAVPISTIRQVRNNIGHIVAVGTTSMRTLESIYWLGKRIIEHNGHRDELSFRYDEVEMRVEQTEPYLNEDVISNTISNKHDPTSEEALDALILYLEHTHQDTLHAETQIMIRPGYQFRIVNQLITNFHQPKSTLLLLVSAFVGGHWKSIYDYALGHDFRFLSYGDSSLLFRNDENS
ncbi:MAG: S-adenosylmethionine:tRNA ribosyltransferase-isomerase [Paludibacteraceae bacterium]|nr:S-adenosylmethionine:tRNA ribosyltransferase-isomerase [Paludibacteraceae bacterium]